MKTILMTISLAFAVSAYAQSATNERVVNTTAKADLQVLPLVRNQLGAGTPAPMITVGTENALYVDDGYYHIPQYMPNYPTAGVIWPRVVEVECEQPVAGKVSCDGYHWLPKLGRGEYLFVIPRIKQPPAPVPRVAPPPPTIVYVEVPRKKKGE